MVKVVIVPGNGVGRVEDSNWYAWLKRELVATGVRVNLRDMPDPLHARQNIWLPFMAKELDCGADTIIVGHSSGAVAAMRFSEQHKVAGIVLVGAYISDLGDPLEKSSGYFDRNWNWEAIKRNAGSIVLFASRDDPFLPWREQQEVAEGLQPELFKFTDRGHFLDREQPELLGAVLDKVNAARVDMGP